jgi:hypothetical protein
MREQDSDADSSRAKQGGEHGQLKVPVLPPVPSAQCDELTVELLQFLIWSHLNKPILQLLGGGSSCSD